jgi:hypothetical protein
MSVMPADEGRLKSDVRFALRFCAVWIAATTELLTSDPVAPPGRGSIGAMKLALMLAILFVTSVAFAQPKKDAPPAPAPEMKRTADAFNGMWMVDASITPPDGKTAKASITIDCTSAALSKAVACVMKGDVPGFGKIEANVLVGWDTYSKSVHFMAITSNEEVHDHKCMWKDEKTIACEPLKGGMMGQPITEDLRFTFDGQNMTFTSVTTMADGKKMSFEGKGKRK